MKIIYCALNLFSVQTPIIMAEEGSKEISCVGTTSMAREIPEDLYNACKKEEVYELRISGPVDVAEVIAQEVRALDEMNYSENRINVESI